AAVHPHSYAVQDMRDPITTVGDTIYYLHYFRQIPVAGLFISGFVGLFFLFATITGLLIHWRNLFTKFFAFIKEGKWKTIWTNAHTVVGIIGLPFQVMYAVTGAFFGLLTLILLPSVVVLYEGDTNQVFNKINPENTIPVDPHAPKAEHLAFSTLLQQVTEAYPDYHITRAVVKNYGKEGALCTWRLDDPEGIVTTGSITMFMQDGVVLDEVSIFPTAKTYSQSVIDFITKLHFGSFGGLLLKVVYFILSLLTCFMIISGVLIWRTARDNGRYTVAQRRFHHRVTKFYLAICLSLFPAFAWLFVLNKAIPMDMMGRTSWVNGLFFIGWLALTIVGLFWNNYGRLFKRYLWMGGVVSLLVPVANGLVTGDWFWQVWNTLPHVAYVDVFWLGAGFTALFLAFRVVKPKMGSDLPAMDTVEKVLDEEPAEAISADPNLEPQLAVQGLPRSQ
ncbi:MAG: PepSY-associated TM helix domain-containing protein, partial [Bacteroidota bacterium]